MYCIYVGEMMNRDLERQRKREGNRTRVHNRTEFATHIVYTTYKRYMRLQCARACTKRMHTYVVWSANGVSVCARVFVLFKTRIWRREMNERGGRPVG